MQVYLLRNTVTGKGYVGITAGSAERRFRAHAKAATRQQPKAAIHRAIKKYGAEAFTMMILATVETWPEAQQLERQFVEEYQTFATQVGYNLTKGGEGALGRRQSDAAKARISAANTGLVHTLEFRKAVSERFLGKPKPPAQREKMSAWQRGAGNHRYGKPVSDETRAKISAAGRGRKLSPEHAEKLHASVRGKPKSEETKRKLREAAIIRLADPTKHPFWGKHHSVETKAKLSDLATAYIAQFGNPMKGRQLSAESREKISEKARGRPAWNRNVPMADEAKQRSSDGHKAYYETHDHPWIGRHHREASKVQMSIAKRGKPAHNRRAILVNGIRYASIVEAGQQSGYTHMQVKYGLEQGRFLDADGPVNAKE